MLLIISFSSRWGGSGSWQSMPLMLFLLLSVFISSKSSCSVVLSGRAYSSETMPSASHAFFLFATYIYDAGFSPTIITASPTVTPRALSADTSPRMRSFTAADIAFPSIILLMGFLLYFPGRLVRVIGKNRLVIIGLGFFRRAAAENNQ